MLQNGVNTKNQDDCWMNMAIKLASNGIGLTSPNPCVGAVIVHENQVIGSGFHKKAGLPHAEREAIANGVANGNAPLFAVFGIRIFRTINHPFETIFQNGIRTRRCFPGSTAWFQSNIQS